MLSVANCPLRDVKIVLDVSNSAFDNPADVAIEGRNAMAMQKFSSQASPELLAELRSIAQLEGRHFQSVLEDAMRQYVSRRNQESVRPEIMAHFYASLERNRRLYELLAR